MGLERLVEPLERPLDALVEWLVQRLGSMLVLLG